MAIIDLNSHPLSEEFALRWQRDETGILRCNEWTIRKNDSGKWLLFRGEVFVRGAESRFHAMSEQYYMTGATRTKTEVKV